MSDERKPNFLFGVEPEPECAAQPSPLWDPDDDQNDDQDDDEDEDDDESTYEPAASHGVTFTAQAKDEDDDGVACDTCANRNNPPGQGPCVSCDMTLAGPESNYCREADPPIKP